MKRAKTILILLTATILMIGTAFAGTETVTIATFDDPSPGSAESMFEIDYAQGILNGSWTGSNLNLNVPFTGTSYSDATFEMDTMTFSGNGIGGYYTDNGGSIRFYDNSNTQVLKIEYDRLWIQSRTSGIDAQDIYGDNVTISGNGISNLSQEQFGFTFANVINDGDVYNATATFTSSAVVPEPATIALLAFGGLMLRKRK